jgi:hypothetical protein
MPGLSSLQVNIKDQPHNLAWINEAEQALLKDLGGSGRPGPMGIPAYDFDDFDDPEGVYDDVSGEGFEGGAQQAAEDAIDGYVEDSGPDEPMTEQQEQEFFSTDGVRDPDFFDEGIFQNIAGPDWEAPPTGPNAGTVPGDIIQVSPKSVNWDAGSPIAAGIANFIQGLLPGGTLTSMAGMKIGDALFGPGMVEVNHDGTPKDLSLPPDEPRDDGNADEEIIPEIVEEKEEEKKLGTMEQFFADKKEEGVPEVLDNIINRLGIQNRTIEPFNEWLAGQSEAMRAADMTTQTNEYRKSLRDQTYPAQTYLPRVQPAADRTIEQSFINNLYPSSKKTSATDALYAELGI